MDGEEVLISTGQVLTGTIVTFDATHYFGDGWGASLTLPVGSVKHEPGTSAGPGATPQRVSGFGDISIRARYELGALWGLKGYRPSVALSAGFGLPSGTHGKTFAEGIGDVPPTQLALGSASFAFLGQAFVTQFLHRYVALTARGGVRLPLSATEAGLTFGEQVDYGLGLLALPGGGIVVSAGVDGSWLGQTESESEGTIVRSGGHWLYGSGGIGGRVGEGWYLGAQVRVPFFASLKGRQLSESFTVNGVVSWTFGGDDEDEHECSGDHEGHGHEGHDHGGHGGPSGDIGPAATGGESFVLSEVLVSGKVTVIDYWADWCVPCGPIGKRLKALAAEEPGMALRFAEVTDDESAVVKEHLDGRAALPRIEIYGRDGKRVRVVQSADPEAVVTAVKQVLAAP